MTSTVLRINSTCKGGTENLGILNQRARPEKKEIRPNGEVQENNELEIISPGTQAALQVCPGGCEWRSMEEKGRRDARCRKKTSR